MQDPTTDTPPTPKGDLLSSMARRLAQAEKDLQAKGAEIAELQAQNQALLESQKKQQPIQPLQRGHNQAGKLLASLNAAREENSSLRGQAAAAWQQIAEMESFLREYGMVWVGEKPLSAQNSLPGNSSQCPPKARPSTSPSTGSGSRPLPRPLRKDPFQAGFPGPQLDPEMRPGFLAANSRPEICGLPFGLQEGPQGVFQEDSQRGSQRGSQRVSQQGGCQVDVELLKVKLAALNKQLGTGLVPGRAAGGFGSLLAREAVDIVLYQDGIQVHESPFAAYSEPGGQAIVQDILEGRISDLFWSQWVVYRRCCDCIGFKAKTGQSY